MSGSDANSGRAKKKARARHTFLRHLSVSAPVQALRHRKRREYA